MRNGIRWPCLPEMQISGLSGSGGDMKLPIKKEYFDAIKNGSKWLEYRDAHITFICESTGRALRKKVTGVNLIDTTTISDMLPSGLFEDKTLIKFELERDTNISNRK